jgi:hypothetical protein
LVLARNADAANVVAYDFASRHFFKMGESRRRVKQNASMADFLRPLNPIFTRLPHSSGSDFILVPHARFP